MSILVLVLLAFTLGHFLLELLASLLNTRSSKQPLPEGFGDVYSQEEYDRAREYQAARERVSHWESTIDLIVLLVFWFGGWFGWLDDYLRAVIQNDILLGVVYLGLLSLGKRLVGIPFEIWSTFGVEERFGFNRTTPGTFIVDTIKGVVLSLLLTTLLLLVMIGFFNSTGQWGWVWAWLGVSAILVAFMVLAPMLIMPLFNKFTPMPEGELRTRLLAMAEACNFPVGRVEVMDGSRRSTKNNAFMAGFGKTRRIALFDTIVEKSPVGELLGVLAHEIGHWKKGHIPIRMLLTVLNIGFTFFLLSLCLHWKPLFDAFYVSQPGVHTGLLVFGLLYTPLGVLVHLCITWLNRVQEFQADRFAAELTGDAETMISALKRLSVNNLNTLTPHPLYVALHYDHPPLPDRVYALRQLEQSKN